MAKACLTVTQMLHMQLTAMRELLCPPPPVRLLLLAGLGNAFFQQATGVEAAVYYTPEVLESAGFVDEDSLLLATVGVGE